MTRPAVHADLMQPDAPAVILASRSASRAALLAAAGIAVTIRPADVDEAAIRATLAGEDQLPPADVAEVLARTKAETISAGDPRALVIGADQILELEGEIFEKPATMDEARRTLLALRGRTHELHSVVAVAQGGDTVWGHTETAHLTMRAMEPDAVGRYLAAAGDGVLQSVGAYQLEGLGVHLFEKIAGDYFTILGLPLLPLLGFLRCEGVMRP